VKRCAPRTGREPALSRTGSKRPEPLARRADSAGDVDAHRLALADTRERGPHLIGRQALATQARDERLRRVAQRDGVSEPADALLDLAEPAAQRHLVIGGGGAGRLRCESLAYDLDRALREASVQKRAQRAEQRLVDLLDAPRADALAGGGTRLVVAGTVVVPDAAGPSTHADPDAAHGAGHDPTREVSRRRGAKGRARSG
jgi:hypothetical protein